MRKLKKALHKLTTQFDPMNIARITKAVGEDTFVNTAISNLKDSKNWASGHLARNIDFDVKKIKNTEVVSWFISKALYSLFVEKGTKPHWAPFKQIREWVKLKTNIPDGRELDALSVAVQKSIAKRGTKAYPFIKTSFVLEHRNYFARLIRQMRKELKGMKI